MIRKTRQSVEGSKVVQEMGGSPRISIFAIPKPFDGHDGVIQRNAIRSWASLKPAVEIILFGNDCPGLDAIAREVDATVLPLRVNRLGTPLLSDAFARARSHVNGSTCCYVNCDIMFGPRLLEIVEQLEKCNLEQWLAIGRRTNLDVTTEINGNCVEQVSELFRRAKLSGVVDSVVCKDYFLFSPSFFRELPDFLVGRGNWDNWMVADAKARDIPVVDVSGRMAVVHQNHDYSHVVGGRKSAYVSGEEARENQRLAGGRHLVVGSTANWALTESGLERRSFPVLTMIRDLPRFVRLLRNLLFLGYIVAGTSLTL